MLPRLESAYEKYIMVWYCYEELVVLGGGAVEGVRNPKKFREEEEKKKVQRDDDVLLVRDDDDGIIKAYTITQQS